ncbi:MAG: hypothetical protein FJ098_03005 [Deltaproteobacteria bacterium]|nr:hypothetical protein [Deltaproteobacteria bacterium]
MQVPKILKSRDRGSGEPGKYMRRGSRKLDQELSVDEWETVLHAFARTGVPEDISAETDIPVEKVRHLLDYGIHRLNVPPIVEAAVDHAEIARRVQAAGLSPDNPPSRNLSLKDPQVQEAITDRIAAEATGASLLLQISLSHLAVQLDWIRAVQRHAKEHGFQLPEGPLPRAYLETVAKVSDSMAKVADRAIRLSKFTAGEPEQNVEVIIAQMIALCTPDEVLQAARTGMLPARFRGQVGGGKESRIIDVGSNNETRSVSLPPSPLDLRGSLQGSGKPDPDEDE